MDVGGSQGGPTDRELQPQETSYPGDHDADEVFAEFWEENAEDELGEGTEPFGPDWPGLAPAAPAGLDSCPVAVQEPPAHLFRTGRRAVGDGRWEMAR